MKKLLFIGLLIVMCILMTGCNYQMIDTTISFDRAIIQLPNGKVVEGKVDSWKDYEDGDQVPVKIDGKTYLTFISNVCLINE